MTEAPRPTDEELNAYVDGRLDPDARSDVEAFLANHPDLQARVDAYRAQNKALHELYDPTLDEPVPDALTAQVARPPTRPRFAVAAQAAAAVLLIAVGFGGGWLARDLAFVGPGGEPNFVDRALGAHVVYVREVRHAVEVQASEEEHLVRWLSKRLGQPLKAPDLTGMGFELVGGRLLPHGTGPAAQFMYEDPSGARLTIYVRSVEPPGDTAFRFASDHGVSAFYWVDGPLEFALIGDVGREMLLGIAQTVYEQLSV